VICTTVIAAAARDACGGGGFLCAQERRASARAGGQVGGQAGGQASADASENLGSPRVVEKVSAGKTIYVVQIGRFANRSEAAKAMRRFDKLGYTVEPFAE
jgi:hypothetical protein